MAVFGILGFSALIALLHNSIFIRV